jgi:nucleoside-diphosphate-sugar epimerase
MRVFVAGATGVLGRRVVPRLVAAGHDVRAVARSAARAAEVRAWGAEPVTVDLFDPVALGEAVRGSDAVVNLATHIPPLSRAARPSAWDENNRIRTEGATNLVDAALAAGARVYVQESLAFAYRDGGGAWLDEDAPRLAGPVAAPVNAAEASAGRFAEHGGAAVVLRFGKFYAADASHTRRILDAARRGLSLDVGDPDGYFPAIHADDAAAAVVAALDAPSGTYNVVDDEPLTRAEQDRALAAAVGRTRLRRPPRMLERAGGSSSELLTSSQRVSNRRFREATGWAPAFPSVREGWAQVAGAGEPVPNRMTRLLAWLLVANGLVVGLYATFFPRAFYDDFPLGRSWVALDGPYNEHLVRDFGAMNLALAVVALGALGVMTVGALRIAAAGWLVFAVPHFVYHARHLDELPAADQWANVVTLAFTVIVPVALLLQLRRPSSPQPVARAIPAPRAPVSR